jgi:hypothetical protein
LVDYQKMEGSEEGIKYGVMDEAEAAATVLLIAA